jgi:hypothetical protein
VPGNSPIRQAHLVGVRGLQAIGRGYSIGLTTRRTGANQGR